MLEKLNFKPIAFYIDKSDEDATIYLSYKENILNNPKIIFKINDNSDKLIENLQAAVTTEPLLSKLKNNYSGLLYIDLRYGNKVYYKFQ